MRRQDAQGTRFRISQVHGDQTLTELRPPPVRGLWFASGMGPGDKEMIDYDVQRIGCGD